MGDLAAWQPTLALRVSAGWHGTAACLLALHPGWWPTLLGGLAANHAVLGATGLWPRSQVFGPVLHRVPQFTQAVAITFDDGPDAEVTPRLLDQLAAAGATASFFCIGARARAQPALVRRIVAAGHNVENHSLTHPLHFAFLVGPQLRREVEDAQALLADLAGVAPRWFRAPMGLRGPPLHALLSRNGLELASWSRRGYDTHCNDPAVVLRRVLRRVSSGDVLLLHDGNAARTPAGDSVATAVLPRLLDSLRAQGLSGVALPGATPGAAGAAGSPA